MIIMKKSLKTRTNYMLVGSDFSQRKMSQQEPRILSQFSQDDNMINAYKSGKDLYATIAMGVYHNKYEDNLECYPDGTLNPEGKKRRSNCKSLLLGIMYGRGTASIAEQIKGTVEEAQEIVDNFYKSFPEVKKWIQESEEFAKKTGYVSDLWGRRRRLPDILLPQYTIRYKDKNMANGDFNPFIGCQNRTTSDKLIKEYENKLSKIKGRKQYDAIKNEALGNGIEIINNGGFISQAQRQCVNARIQGSAASMTKKAMIKIYKDYRIMSELDEILNDDLLKCEIVETSENAVRRVDLIKWTYDNTFSIAEVRKDTGNLDVTDVPGTDELEAYKYFYRKCGNIAIIS